MEDFLRWLDVTPGRSWLLLGPHAAELAQLVRHAYKPAGVAVGGELAAQPDQEPAAQRDAERRLERGEHGAMRAAQAASFPASTFDVVLATEKTPAAELRRLAVPAGMAAMLLAGEPAALEREFREAGLYAVQSRLINGLAAVRGTR